MSTIEFTQPGANPTAAIYNASVVKTTTLVITNATIEIGLSSV
jgi:hypothetical protein